MIYTKVPARQIEAGDRLRRSTRLGFRYMDVSLVTSEPVGDDGLLMVMVEGHSVESRIPRLLAFGENEKVDVLREVCGAPMNSRSQRCTNLADRCTVDFHRSSR